MPRPITIYGATDCDDTQHTREYLISQGVSFQEVNIDEDEDAERFVVFINGGFRSTPTIVLGEGNLKIIVTEPTNKQLQAIAAQTGNLISG
jgi:mycoredoxin